MEAALLRFHILGRVTAIRDRVPVHCGGPKQRALLTALLLNANRPVSVDRLVELVWSEAEPKSAIANLRTYVGGIRQGIGGERVLSHPSAYELRVLSGEFDVHEFTTDVTSGRAALEAGAVAEGAEHLGRALRLWRGPAGEGVVPRTFALDNLLTILDEERLAVFEEWASALIITGRAAATVSELRRFLSENPLRERAWRHLMVARYQCGDIAGAVAAFQRARAVLADQLGLEPGTELIDLHRAILRRDLSLVLVAA